MSAMNAMSVFAAGFCACEAIHAATDKHPTMAVIPAILVVSNIVAAITFKK